MMAAKGEAEAPAVIVSDRTIAGFLAPAMPDVRFPAFWEAEDPRAALREAGREARVLVGYGGPVLEPAMLDALPQLGLVQVVGAGFDGIDLDDLRRRGVALANAGGVNAEAVADHALALALGARRDVVGADRWVREGHWTGAARYPLLRTFSLERAGIVGLGHIGKAIARRLAGFGIETEWWGPREKPGEALPRAESLRALAERASLLFVACPGGPETEGLIDAEVIAAVGADGLIVTVARGSVIDEDALIAALRDGRLGGAALDVFAEEPTPAARWAGVPNVLLSPHHAGASAEAIRAMQEATIGNIRRFLAGEPILNRVA